MARDMTEKQFRAALAKHGMRLEPLGGIRLSCGVIKAFIRLQGLRRRHILAHCLKEDERFKREERERRRRAWGEAAALTSGVAQ